MRHTTLLSVLAVGLGLGCVLRSSAFVANHPSTMRLNQATILEAAKKGKARVPLLDPPENLLDALWDWYVIAMLHASRRMPHGT